MRVPALLVLGLLAACRTPPARWNETCPMSGRPVAEDSFFEHAGRRVYFCNPECAREGALEPERWLERVYGR